MNRTANLVGVNWEVDEFLSVVICLPIILAIMFCVD